MLSVAGGKLTTWRATAEEVVDAALALLPRERRRIAAPCATAGTPLAGLAPADLGRRLHVAHGLELEVAGALARRIGQLAWTACELATDHGELRPLAAGLDLCAAEVRCHLRFAGVVKLCDLLLRRVRLGMWRPAAARELVGGLRSPVCSETGWTSAHWEREVEEYGLSAEGWTLAGVREEEKA